jgi:hypothetical protein
MRTVNDMMKAVTSDPVAVTLTIVPNDDPNADGEKVRKVVERRDLRWPVIDRHAPEGHHIVKFEDVS